MAATVINGRMIAASIRSEVAAEVHLLLDNGYPKPGLATVLVGENPASKVHVQAKHRACQEVGIESFGYELPATASQQEVEALVKSLNEDPRVHGILVQMPLPSGIDEERVLNGIRVEKDVDGFHPLNIGRLAQKGREPLFVPCTPAGVMYLLRHAVGDLQGKRAVVIGRSNIVGMPLALMLLRANVTVTVCHSYTRRPEEHTRMADVLISAMGKPATVRGDWIKPGSVVIDVGFSRVEDLSQKRGYRLVGDVAFEEAACVAGYITPVPGGVGPMTIAMLLKNTVRAAKILGHNGE